jgi:hypothetical protein
VNASIINHANIETEGKKNCVNTVAHGSASPSVVKYRCMGVDGCTWSDGDGTPRGGYVGGGTF